MHCLFQRLGRELSFHFFNDGFIVNSDFCSQGGLLINDFNLPVIPLPLAGLQRSYPRAWNLFLFNLFSSFVGFPQLLDALAGLRRGNLLLLFLCTPLLLFPDPFLFLLFQLHHELQATADTIGDVVIHRGIR